MKTKNIYPFEVVHPLGNNNKRKFNQVTLVKNNRGELFVRKTCSINDTIACASLLREFKFAFTEKGLPQKGFLDKNDATLELILPYKKGITLDHYWKQLKKRERTQFLPNFVSNFLKLLNIVHQNHIFHNDIKPSNILIDDNDVHLIDFGMASTPNEPERKALYTLNYSSPELILNQLHLLDASSDLYSFAMVLVELISGKSMYSHENPAILTQMAVAYPIALKEIVPKAFVGLLEQLLTKPQFTSSPNRMAKTKLEEMIVLAQNTRALTSEALKKEFQFTFDNFNRRKKWFFSKYQIA